MLYAVSLPVFVFDAWVVLAFQESSRYGEVIAFTLVAVLVRAYLLVLPGWPGLRPIERWAAGDAVDPVEASNASYVYVRRATARTGVADAIWSGVFLTVVAIIAGV